MLPKSEIVYSPLAPDQPARYLYSRRCEDLIQRWMKAFNIDVSDQFSELTEIHCYQCPVSSLVFFTPDTVAGDEVFYAKLQEFEWYYALTKWEYRCALKDIRPDSKVIEVGCGNGAFLKKLRDHQVNAEGLEINTQAIQEAIAQGLNVQADDLSNHAEQHPAAYDYVCAFQVLEHVIEPMVFLDSMYRLLRPGGVLILATPNHDAFIKDAPNPLLDMPPHHMSRWTKASYRYVAETLSMKIIRFAEEPLARNHIDFYLRTLYVKRLNQNKAMWPYNCIRPLYHALLWTGLRQLYRGHTLYVAMRKTIV